MEKTEKKEKKKGGCLKTVLIILLVLILAIAAIVLIWYHAHKDEIEELSNQRFHDTLTGETAPDFEVTTTDGKTVSLSSLLEGKEAVAVVLFATWCGPCEEEFPFMDTVYQKYNDKFGMIAINVDRIDDEKAVKEYADSHDLSFPIAKGNDSLGVIETTAYPTTLIIDRNGKIGLVRVGSMPDAETFEKVITTFMGDDYQERQLAYYTFTAYSGKTVIPGVEFTLTSESGTETYTTGEDGTCDVFLDKPEDLQVKVISVPDGFSIDGTGEMQSGTGSTYIPLPVK